LFFPTKNSILKFKIKMPHSGSKMQKAGKCKNADLTIFKSYKQEWLSPTERALVSAISLRHIIWLPHESHAGMSLPTADLRVHCRHLATSRESKAHFGLPWVRPWDYRGKCYKDEKRIQCLSNASQHVPIYLQPFPSNSTYKFKSSPF